MTEKAEENIIVYGKQFDRLQPDRLKIPLTIRIRWFPDGSIMPCMYWTPDQSCHLIEHVYQCTPLAFLKDRGEGLRFKVRAETIETPEPFPDHGDYGELSCHGDLGNHGCHGDLGDYGNHGDHCGHGSEHSRHELYLYFADRKFFEKNIVDERYGHEGKEFISVTLDVFPNGNYELVYFWVSENRYMVEKTLEVKPRGSFHAGGVGIQHKVEARQVNADNDEDPDPENRNKRIAALYFEINKWFVRRL